MAKKIFLIIVVFLSFSCQKNSQQISTKGIIDIEDSALINKNIVYSKYKIPLPLDLFNYFIKDSEFDKDFLIPLNLGDRCLNDQHKALVLGLANADLAFCAVLNHSQLSSEYFKLAQNLASDLGINTGYTQDLYSRFIENINNSDSIQKLADEAYWKTCNFLENNHKYNILPFVVASGWYESVYLLIKAKNAQIYSDSVKQIILKQEDGFRRVQKFLYDAQVQTSAQYYYQDIKKIIQNIQKILDIYTFYYANVSKRKFYYNQLINSIFKTRQNFIKGKL